MNAVHNFEVEHARRQVVRARRVIALVDARKKINGSAESDDVNYHRGYLVGMVRALTATIDRLVGDSADPVELDLSAIASPTPPEALA